ncbi:rRNA biogenesis protein rrp5 [Ceratobasidium sp. 394]|nr:rRNA biogenesis protein rrp5 [Ceratobasidium sp. 394]
MMSRSHKAKRSHEPGSYSTEAATPAGKKTKFGLDGKAKDVSRPTTAVVAEEVDFPRGGGVTLEQLNAGVERMEVDGDGSVFTDGPKKLKAKKQSVGGTKDRNHMRKDDAAAAKKKSETTCAEHLNYKRLEPGQKLLGQITSILPLALIVSLPNQLMGHVPIINVSPQLTSRLDSVPSRSCRSPSPSSSSEEDDNIPLLTQLFSLGQYVSCVVKQVCPPKRERKSVELSVRPGDINVGVGIADIRVGFNISGAIKSVEDHGYTVDFGLADISGFIPSKNATNKQFTAGQVVSTTASNFRKQSVPSGLNVQILGFFNGTIELFHLPRGIEKFKLGDKAKARVLWDLPGSSPPKFALSLLPHVLGLVPTSTLPPPPLSSEGEPKKKKRRKEAEDGVKPAEAYPVGMILESVRIT